jgi:glycosyltransferase involved in cell wall biosynthesis
MNKAIIFHHPLPIVDNGSSGSQVRPYKMLQAFEALGFDVEVVTGYAAERRQHAQRIRKELGAGRCFSFVYSESSTMPTLLTEPNHLPISPKIDFGLLARMKAAGVPVGLYYRDVHWRFQHYRNSVPWLKRAVSIPFYHYDWMIYRKTIDKLFVPSQKMAEFLPTSWPEERLSILPPGCEVYDSERVHPTRGDLQLFYVGGVIPPLYNLKPMIDLIEGLPGIHLTICCRPKEWELVRCGYAIGDKSNITVVHAQGDELTELYAQADLFLLYWASNSYLSFVVPIKLLETVGYGVPVVTTSGTEAARFVAAEKVGWVVSSNDELRWLLNHLQSYPGALQDKQRQVIRARGRHTWLERARTAADVLTRAAVGL